MLATIRLTRVAQAKHVICQQRNFGPAKRASLLS